MPTDEDNFYFVGPHPHTGAFFAELSCALRRRAASLDLVSETFASLPICLPGSALGAQGSNDVRIQHSNDISNYLSW